MPAWRLKASRAAQAPNFLTQAIDARLLEGLVKLRQRFGDNRFGLHRQSARATPRSFRTNEQGARDRSRAIRLQKLVEPSPLHPELAAGAQDFRPVRLIGGSESADHGLSGHSLFPDRGVDRRFVELLTHSGSAVMLVH